MVEALLVALLVLGAGCGGGKDEPDSAGRDAAVDAADAAVDVEDAPVDVAGTPVDAARPDAPAAADQAADVAPVADVAVDEAGADTGADAPPDAAADRGDPCGCAGAVGNNHVLLPLACYCGPTGCPDIAAYLAQPRLTCPTMQPLVRARGCGKVRFYLWSGSGATAVTFDERSGQVVGVEESSDVPWGRCGVFGYVYGEPLREPNPGSPGGCDGFMECTVCGTAPGIPACS